MIKPQYQRHIESARHIKKLNNAEPKPDKTEIQELKDMVIFLCAEVSSLKASLQECKEIIKKNNEKPSTYEAPPTPPPSPAPQIIYVSPPPPAPEPEPTPEPKKETCNPVYIAKKLNENPDNADILPIDKFFHSRNEQVDFNFDDIDDLKDVGKKYAVDKITDFVKNNKKILPFKFHKSNWYIKNENGTWIKEEHESNKNCKTGSENYNYNIIVKSFIGIFQKRLFNHFEKKLGDNFMYHIEYDRIQAEVFARENYRNSDILKHIAVFFD